MTATYEQARRPETDFESFHEQEELLGPGELLNEMFVTVKRRMDSLYLRPNATSLDTLYIT